MGVFNLSDDDQARIDAMPGTSEVPPTGALEGLATAIPKGVVSGLDKVGQLGNDLANTGAGYSFFETPTPNDLIAHLQQPAPDSEPYKQAAAAMKVATDWAATGQDPRVTGTVGRIAAGTSEGISIGLAGGAVAGPWGAAGLLGATEGYSGYNDAKAQGVDETTAREQGAITGVVSAGSAFLPMKFGKTLAQSILGGAAANITLGAAQRGLTSEVLEAHGYHDMASQYRIADGEAIASDLILGGAFGAFGHATARRVNPADVDAAAAVATEDHFNRSGPGIPTDPQTATLHADTMAGALHDLANGDLPQIPPERAQALVDNVVPDPTHSWATAPDVPVTATEPFRKWFGKSSVVDADGSPLRVYHGTAADITQFVEGHGTSDGFHFTSDPTVANRFAESRAMDGGRGARVIPAYLSIENPKRVAVASNAEIAQARAEGHDGLIVGDQGHYVAFAPEQIKSAVGNSGEFSPHNPSITDSPLHEAAKAELPGFEAAAADIKPIEMPPEAIPPPKPAPEPAAAGEPAKVPDVPLDDFHGSVLDHLVHNHGDETYVTDDGREVSYRQMADEMQQQRNEADSFAKLHDVAAACAARNGV